MSMPPSGLAQKKQAAFDLFTQGRYREAHEAIAGYCAKHPRDLDARGLLGHCLLRLGQIEEAARCFHALVERVPGSWRAHAELAQALHLLGREEEAVARYRRATELNPRDPSLWDNLGIVLCCQARYEEAITCHRRAMETTAGFATAHSNLLLTLHYHPDVQREALFREHLVWGKRHGAPAAAPPHGNSRDPDRRLRIGYLSRDLRTHSVAYFIEPLLATHDRDRFEVWCYASPAAGDATAVRLRTLASGWRELTGHPPAAVARQIRSDGIDILVELGGHTHSDLLLACAHRPAPVQVTYLGYPDTTGLPAIDYRLVDETTDPAGAEQWCSEALVRLPGCFLCYHPPHNAPPVEPPPVTRQDHVTFGSFNNLAKVNDAVVALWSRLLHVVAGSRLFIKAPSLDDPATRDRYRGLFADHCVAAERITLRGRAQEVGDHLALYREVDIALDPFPYNGTTTTCEALWMGAPVVTLAGMTHAGRVGTSLLKAAGLDEHIATGPEQFLDVATRLATDRERLVALRASLRERMRASSLCDAERFTRTLEESYRTMWRRWCTTRP